MKDLKDLFEATLDLEEADKMKYKPGTELTVDVAGEDVLVTVIAHDEKAGKVQVKDSAGKEHFYPVGSIKK